jgi:hypothetical protein
MLEEIGTPFVNEAVRGRREFTHAYSTRVSVADGREKRKEDLFI